jgi:hypothetical protein
MRYGNRTRTANQVTTWVPDPKDTAPGGSLNVMLRDFRPSDLLGLELWLDASDASTITSSGSPATVSQWDDKSGNGRNVTQGTAANQPTTGSTTQNGLNVLVFDGSNDSLASANGALQLADLTAFCVARSQTASRTICGVSHATTHSSPFWRWVFYHAGANTLTVQINGVARAGFGAIYTVTGRLFVLDTAAGDSWVNTSFNNDAVGATNTYPNSTPFFVGANASNGEVLNGHVGEIVVYGRSLSADERALVTGYLQQKWATL